MGNVSLMFVDCDKVVLHEVHGSGNVYFNDCDGRIGSKNSGGNIYTLLKGLQLLIK